MGNKNIWIFNHYAITPDMPGITRHYDFSKELTKRGYNVSIFASSFHYILLKEMRNYHNGNVIVENHNGINFIWLKTKPYLSNNWKRIVNMFSYSYVAYKTALNITHKIEKPDIIIGSTIHPFAALTALKISKKYKVPFIFEVRDLWPQSMIDIGLWSERGLRSKIFSMIESKLVKNAKSIITLSPLTEDYLLQKYNYKECFYIPNGVDIKEFDNGKIIYKNQTKFNETLKHLAELKNDGNFIVMYAGAICLTNNIEILIRSAEVIRDFYKNNKIKILIVGGGQEKKRYSSLIKNLNLNNIQILEPVKKGFVSLLLNFADVFILIQGRVFWGSTNKLFDYLSSCKPIITAVSCKHNDPAEEIRCGLSVPPDNPKALAKAIIKLYSMSNEEKEEMGNRGRDYIKKNHSIPVLVDKITKALEAV